MHFIYRFTGRPPSQSLCLATKPSLGSHSYSYLFAVVALRVTFNSIFKRVPKAYGMVANCLSAIHRDQSDCNGGWS